MYVTFIAYFSNLETLEIVVQPKSRKVKLKSMVLFTCNARGPGPLSYEWYKDENRIQGKFLFIMLYAFCFCSIN